VLGNTFLLFLPLSLIGPFVEKERKKPFEKDRRGGKLTTTVHE